MDQVHVEAPVLTARAASVEREFYLDFPLVLNYVARLLDDIDGAAAITCAAFRQVGDGLRHRSSADGLRRAEPFGPATQALVSAAACGPGDAGRLSSAGSAPSVAPRHRAAGTNRPSFRGAGDGAAARLRQALVRRARRSGRRGAAQACPRARPEPCRVRGDL